ncbi:MAG: TolC family outer membrane protein [Alphaproteobacteria bacterium]
MRKLWSLLSVGLLAVTPLAAGAETIADALSSAYRNSQLLEKNQAVLRAADEDVAQAVGELLPVLSWEATIGVQGTYSPGARSDFLGNSIPHQSDFAGSDTLSLIASMPLFDFGRGQLNIELKAALVNAARYSLISVEQEVLFDAAAAYVDVWLQIQLVAAQEANVRLLTQDLRAANDRFDVGEITRTDVALTEAQLASANAALAAAQGNLNVARENYKAKVGHYPNKLKPLPKPPKTADTLAGAQAIAVKSHPAILQAQYLAKAADIAVAAARAEMLPNVNGEASVSQTFAGDNGGELFSGGTSSVISERLGLTMRQTLYAGGRLSSRLRQQIALSQQAHADLLQTVINVKEAAGKAWSNIQVARASMVAGDEQVRAAQAALDGVRQEAQLGSRTVLDVLNAEQDLLNARSQRLQSEADLYLGRLQLLSSMGLLTVDHLNLGIPTFDPDAYLNAVKTAPATTARGEKLDRILKTLGK